MGSETSLAPSLPVHCLWDQGPESFPSRTIQRLAAGPSFPVPSPWLSHRLDRLGSFLAGWEPSVGTTPRLATRRHWRALLCPGLLPLLPRLTSSTAQAFVPCVCVCAGAWVLARPDSLTFSVLPRRFWAPLLLAEV